jgi:hypothetical protein
VDGGLGVNAQGNLQTSEFSPPICQLFLETFEVTGSRELHIDLFAREHYDDGVDTCTTNRARTLSDEPNCIWVERLDGERI